MKSDHSNLAKYRHRIYRFPKGHIFTVGDVAKNQQEVKYIKMLLKTLVQGGSVRHIVDEIYIKPDFNVTGDFEELAPTVEQVISKISHHKGENIQLHGAGCANKYGLNSDSTFNNTYFTSGQSRVLKIGEQIVDLKHTSTKKYFLSSNRNICDAIALMYHLESVGLTPKVIELVKAKLSEKELQELINLDLPVWMLRKFKTVSNKSKDSNTPTDINDPKPEYTEHSVQDVVSEVGSTVSSARESSSSIDTQGTKTTESVLKIANQILNDEVDLVEIKLDLGNFKAQYYIRLNSQSLFSKMAKKLFS